MWNFLVQRGMVCSSKLSNTSSLCSKCQGQVRRQKASTSYQGRCRRQAPTVCRDAVLRQIARHLPPQQKDQALALLLRVFDSAMRQSSSPYRDELALVQDISGRMDAKRRAEWLAQLRVEFKAKRNFIRDLPGG